MRARPSPTPVIRLVSGLVLALVYGCEEPSEDDASDDGSGDAAAGSSDASTSSSDDSTGETESLIDVAAWQLDAMIPSPLAADRPEEVECEHGFGLEDGLFEVDTELCNWGAFAQPTLAPVEAGDTVEIIMLHDTLYSEDEDATAHVAVALGDETIWETTIAIPAPNGYLRPMITVEQPVPAGTLVHLHVHNHGYNNYRVVDITVTH